MDFSPESKYIFVIINDLLNKIVLIGNLSDCITSRRLSSQGFLISFHSTGNRQGQALLLMTTCQYKKYLKTLKLWSLK